MSYLKQKFKQISCDVCGKVISLLIALHIIIALVVVGTKYYNKTQANKVGINNEKHK
jgi:predicted negative regulator of RcsB-dependent stress response